MRSRAWFAVGVFGLTLAATSSPAHADEKRACVAASDEAQKLRDERKLVKAREQMLLCARDACPSVIRKDCSQWLTEVEASLPSVTLSARDSGGHDIAAAHVTLDGAVLTDKLDGKAIFVDPGPHTFKFEVEGKPAVEQQTVVREGERNRAVTAQFSGGEAVPVAAPPVHDNTPPPNEPEHKKTPVVGYAVTGIGVLALGGAAVFWLTGKGAVSDLKNGCGVPFAGQTTGHCQQGDVDAAKTKLLVGDILAGVGIVAVGVGVYMILTGSSAPTPAKVGQPARRLRALELKFTPVLSPAPGGGVAGLGARF